MALAPALVGLCLLEQSSQRLIFSGISFSAEFLGTSVVLSGRLWRFSMALLICVGFMAGSFHQLGVEQ